MFRARHAIEMRYFLEKIRKNPSIKISEAKFGSNILWALKVNGNEERSLTKEEICFLLDKYLYFKDFFTRQGLWLYQSEIDNNYPLP